MYSQRALLAATVPIRLSDTKVEKNKIILFTGSLERLDGYQVNSQVYLLSKEQAEQFKIEMLKNAKEYTIADVRKLKEPPHHSEENYMYMNPEQAEIYLSLGIDRLVIIGKGDMERIFPSLKK